MRLWSIHPKYLDAKGLVALWREGLLALKVLKGQTKGYKNHPQLYRFKNSGAPIDYISTFLYFVYEEANSRGYNFDFNKLDPSAIGLLDSQLAVYSEQMDYEYKHLMKKLYKRDRKQWYKNKRSKGTTKVNPIFRVYNGPIEPWERLK